MNLMKFYTVTMTMNHSSSVLIQYIYEDLDFQSPFFLTYMATSLLAFHLPAWHIGDRCSKSCSNQEPNQDEDYRDTLSLVNDGYHSKIEKDSRCAQPTDSFSGNPTGEQPHYHRLQSIISNRSEFVPAWMPSFIKEEHYEIIKIALVIAPLWFAANCFYNYSLLMTSVSSSTIIRLAPSSPVLT